MQVIRVYLIQTITFFDKFFVQKSFAGIENHIIRGLWKTICSEPGEKVESKCLWNVLFVENGWRFIQPSYTPVKYYNK